MFVNALNSMLSLFACMLIGFICYRKEIFKEEMTLTFNKFLMNITVPAMIIGALNVKLEPELLKEGMISIAAGFIFHFIYIVIAFVTMKMFKIKSDLKSIWLFGLTFANIMFLGFPLIKDIMGAEKLFHVTLFNISFNILVFSVGVLIINYGSKEKISVKKIVMQPAFISVLIGIAIFMVPWQLPSFIAGTLGMFGAITPPLSMFIVGGTLASASVLKALKNKQLYLFSFIKLVLIPVIVYYVAGLVIDNHDLVVIFMVLSGTPSAVLTVILIKMYNKDAILASEVVFVTTALSVVTIPVLLKIFY